MDNKTYEISSAEWEVMNIIWMKNMQVRII